MSKEIFEALHLLESERGIPMDFMIEKIKKAIITACKNGYDGNEDAIISIHEDTGEFRVSLMKEVVDDVLVKGKEISLEDSLNYDNEGNELHLEDVLGTDTDLVSDEYERQVERNFISKEINKLNQREKQIMVLRYGLNNTESYTQKEVAEMLGISQSYISRIEKKVIRNIKNLMKMSLNY